MLPQAPPDAETWPPNPRSSAGSRPLSAFAARDPEVAQGRAAEAEAPACCCLAHGAPGAEPQDLEPFFVSPFFFLNNLGEKNLSEILGMEWGGRFRGNMSYGWEVDENVSDFPPS